MDASAVFRYGNQVCLRKNAFQTTMKLNIYIARSCMTLQRPFSLEKSQALDVLTENPFIPQTDFELSYTCIEYKRKEGNCK